MVLCDIFLLKIFMQNLKKKNKDNILWGGNGRKKSQVVFYKRSGRCHYKLVGRSVASLNLKGWLGLFDLFRWNIAAILHQIWCIIQPNSVSIWIMWLKQSF